MGRNLTFFFVVFSIGLLLVINWPEAEKLPTEVACADINQDGSVGDADVKMMKDIILEIVSCPGGWQRCDLNKNDKVNIIDLQILINIIAGKMACPSSPPANLKQENPVGPPKEAPLFY